MFKKIALIVLISIALTSSVCLGDNTLFKGKYDVIITVDTAPGAPGYPIDGQENSEVTVKIAGGDVNKVTFSVQGGGGTVTLEFKMSQASAWEAEGEYTAGDCKIIEDRSHSRMWRARVLDGDFADTGDLIFGFSY